MVLTGTTLGTWLYVARSESPSNSDSCLTFLGLVLVWSSADDNTIESYVTSGICSAIISS